MVGKKVLQEYSMKNAILKLLGMEYSYPRVTSELKRYASKYIISPIYKERIDIIMPTYNRLRETKRTIKNLYSSTKIDFNLILIDNCSDKDTKDYLQSLSKQKGNIKVIFRTTNIGASGARIDGLKYATSEYVAFLDNDIIVMPNYFENLIGTLEARKDIVAVQSKVVFPDRSIQINRPYFENDEERIVFYDKDISKRYDDAVTEKQELCSWIPIGATLWRRDIFKKYSLDINLGTSYEDNDLTLRLHNDGYLFINCPSAICLHVTSQFAPDESKDQNYTKDRFGYQNVRKSAKLFFEKHGLIFFYGDPIGYVKTLGFDSVDEYENFVKG